MANKLTEDVSVVITRIGLKLVATAVVEGLVFDDVELPIIPYELDEVPKLHRWAMYLALEKARRKLESLDAKLMKSYERL